MNAPARSPAPITAAEFERMVRAGVFGEDRVELRDGWVERMAPQYYPHARIKRMLADSLKAAIGASRLPLIVDQEASVAFGPSFQPMPDIIVWEPGALAAEPDGPIPAHAVRLIVEVSDTTLGDDLGAKLADYARLGLYEYWVADVTGRLLLLNCEAGESRGVWGYNKRVPVAFGGPIAALTLPLTADGTGL